MSDHLLNETMNDLRNNLENGDTRRLARGPALGQTSTAVPFVLAATVLVAAAFGGWRLWQVRQFEQSRGQAIPEGAVGPPITDFELTERSGQPFRSADMRGKVWVVSYFFTTCPGPCLILNRNVQSLNSLLELEDVIWVSITCDPSTDTVEALRKYADNFQADPQRWLFCRADLPYTQRVAKGMGIPIHRQLHYDHAVVMDKAGKIRGLFDATSTYECQRLRTLLLECLEEEPPQEEEAETANETTDAAEAVGADVTAEGAEEATMEDAAGLEERAER